MLILRNNYAAYPTGRVCSLTLPHETLLVYSSAESVVILDARTLKLNRILSFAEAFPGSIHTETVITHLVVDSGMKLVIAAAGLRVAVWSLSKLQRGTWRIHSTLVLSDRHAITSLDIKSGLLAVGGEGFLSVYTLILENDLPTWSPKWTVPVVTPSTTLISPSFTYIVTASTRDNVVRNYSTTSGRLVQSVPHPRPVVNIAWRHTKTSSRDDLVLFTTTNDSTLRIFLPVLDAPHHLQLHASLDIYSSLPFSVLSSNGSPGNSSSIFWMEKDTVHSAIEASLKKNKDPDDARARRLQEIVKENWDLFLRILEDGSVIVTAVANIDRRPPTLLRQFTLQQSSPGVFKSLPTHLLILPSVDAEVLTVVSTSPVVAQQLHPLSFFDAHADGLQTIAADLERVPIEEKGIERFVRTLEGRGVGTLREGSLGEAWTVKHKGTALTRSGTWTSADFVVVLKGGKEFATHCSKNNIFTLHSTPKQQLLLPSLGYLFTMPSAAGEEYIIGITDKLSIILIHLNKATSSLSHTISSLPIDSTPEKILPVDPMAWGLGHSWAKHDVLLSISRSGELGFWVPEENSHVTWRCTGTVKTARTNIKRARCSSAKKTAIITHGDKSEELTIWDSFESEFASGLEYNTIYSEPINDLDWTSTLDNHSILAVGFSHRIELVCQQRMTYFDERPAWRVCWTIDISSIIPYSISDSIWLTHGSFLIGAGHHILLYGGYDKSEGNASPQGALYNHVDDHNRPLRDYHPQLILQCLYWEKTELVKDIIVKLARWVSERIDDHYEPWVSLPAEDYWTEGMNITSRSVPRKVQPGPRLFEVPEDQEIDSNRFSRPLVLRLLKDLETQPLPDLTHNENTHLRVLIQIALEIEEQRRALDANGLRYIISLRSFSIFNDQSQSPPGAENRNGLKTPREKRERLRYRDMMWAFHSESQELLLQASISAHNGKLGWTQAKAVGLPIWLRSLEVLKAQMEEIARNQYMSGEYRDPTECSLFYFALGKVKLVHGLWRQAAWHNEQGLMLKFLSNDFTEPRWRTAALKNAYALLSKRRYAYAAAFFLLGNSLKDAVNVCVRQLGDFQLAVMLARVVEQSNEGAILSDVVTNTVLPIAIREGNRWLGSWAFWLLHRRDLAVRILLTPLRNIAESLNIQVTEIGESHYDDPSLALLFSQLKSKTLQAAKGTSEISSYVEFSFVLQMARVFCRLGCHVLALDLVRSWSFERPTTHFNQSSSMRVVGPPSPTSSRHTMFTLEPGLRRASVLIDMDIPSLPPTRPASPGLGMKAEQLNPEKANEDGDLLARKAGLGSLMKAAKLNVQVPEFDMNAFFG